MSKRDLMLPSTGASKGQIQAASALIVESYFATLPAGQRRARWLAMNNRYRLDCIRQYKTDLDSHTVDDSELLKYISASCPTHVIDGWAFLGRAVDAALRGDSYGAIHMAYYAELRAAMSILAGQGVGVFNSQHPIVDKTGRTQRFATPMHRRSGTHAMVWPMLHYWSTLRRSSLLLDKLIIPNGTPLSQWLTFTGSSLSLKALAENWFSSWGLDLVGLDGDHERRNEVSYRPSEFKRPGPLGTIEIARFVEELWALFEPGSNGAFPALERELMRRARRKRIATEPIVVDGARLGLSASGVTQWETFLKDEASSFPLELAETAEAIEKPKAHLGVISRAALLLFVATTAARRVLTTAGYTRDDMQFWWSTYGRSRGLWSRSEDIESPADCWADVANAISQSSEWRAEHATSTTPLRDWRQAQAVGLSDFSGFELVGVWGLVP